MTRVRPPRVKITYDVETGGAIEKKELPFIVGIMADLAGAAALPTKLKERKFVEIDRDNFDAVLKKLAPSLKIQVPNKLEDGGKDLSLTLGFASMADFDPVNVVQNLAAGDDHPLCKLYDARNSLRDLLAKLDGNDDLDGILNAIADDTAEQAKLRADLDAQKTLLAAPAAAATPVKSAGTDAAAAPDAGAGAGKPVKPPPA